MGVIFTWKDLHFWNPYEKLLHINISQLYPWTFTEKRAPLLLNSTDKVAMTEKIWRFKHQIGTNSQKGAWVCLIRKFQHTNPPPSLDTPTSIHSNWIGLSIRISNEILNLIGNVQADPDENLPIWMTIFLKKEGPKGLTVWKFHNFPITQILRKIILGDSRSAKSAIFNTFGGFEFLFFFPHEFLHFLKAQITKVTKFCDPKIARISSFRISRFS